MASAMGYGTGLAQLTSRETVTVENNNHAWQVMFAYEGPHAAMRMVRLGPIPGEFPDTAVRQLLLDKQAASDTSRRSAKARKVQASGDRCLLCRLAFGSEYDDPGLGRVVIQRNRRNRFYCNICDLFIRACPGQATLMLPVLVVDVKDSREVRNRVGLPHGQRVGRLLECVGISKGPVRGWVGVHRCFARACSTYRSPMRTCSSMRDIRA